MPFAYSFTELSITTKPKQLFHKLSGNICSLLGLFPLRLLILCISVGAAILLYCFFFTSLTGVRAFWEMISISITPESYELCSFKFIYFIILLFFFTIDGNSVAILEFLCIKKIK